ncbi:MAG: hypothetical protein GY909_15880 [Oligoflexia bacterium]|nr:hypothetical protein [Oligoflexia bacterium]
MKEDKKFKTLVLIFFIGSFVYLLSLSKIDKRSKNQLNHYEKLADSKFKEMATKIKETAKLLDEIVSEVSKKEEKVKKIKIKRNISKNTDQNKKSTKKDLTIENSKTLMVKPLLEIDDYFELGLIEKNIYFKSSNELRNYVLSIESDFNSARASISKRSKKLGVSSLYRDIGFFIVSDKKRSYPGISLGMGKVSEDFRADINYSFSVSSNKAQIISASLFYKDVIGLGVRREFENNSNTSFYIGYRF